MTSEDDYTVAEHLRDAIRQEAFKEAAELVRFRSGPRSLLRLLSEEILDLGEPDPRTRSITVQLKEWTYTFDRDEEHPVQRFRIGEQVTLFGPPELLLYALEQERTILCVEKARIYKRSIEKSSKLARHLPWSERDAARLEHLNLFLGERT